MTEPQQQPIVSQPGPGPGPILTAFAWVLVVTGVLGLIGSGLCTIVWWGAGIYDVYTTPHRGGGFYFDVPGILMLGAMFGGPVFLGSWLFYWIGRTILRRRPSPPGGGDGRAEPGHDG